MVKTIFSILLFASVVNAETCLEIPEAQFNEWVKLRPKAPALSLLIKAKKLVETEQDFALSLGTDKTAHCYLGCRINSEINYQTAHYLAWQKEQNDATDCNPETHFDVADYDATLSGAKFPAEECVPSCKRIF